MQIQAFETEHFYAEYEFAAPHLLSASDCEAISVQELMQMAGMSLEDLGALKLGYTESQGDPALRQAIAATYQGVSADDVVVLATPIEGIYLTMRALLGSEDEAVVLSPAYDALSNLPSHISSNVRRWQLTPTTSGWRLDFSALYELLSDKTKLVVVNFPHNPTGFLPTPDEFKELTERVQQCGAWLFCDEMYRGLEFGEHSQLQSATELYERSVVLSGLSKTYGLPGLRCGWLVIRNAALLDELMNWKMYTSICAPGPVEFLAQAALRASEQIISRNIAIIRDNLALAKPFFARWSHLFTWRPPLAGSVALVESTQGATTDYCHAVAKQAGVVLLPSAFLGGSDKFIRFGFGRKNFSESLQAFEAYLQSSDTAN
ncbi:MAG: aminotransferase class I/II-fold pyridoxal phosphate-dependent enzyme [Pseudomonadales bacterium]